MMAASDDGVMWSPATFGQAGLSPVFAGKNISSVSPRANLPSVLSAPVVPMLLRMSVPNLFSMLAAVFVAGAETSYVGRSGWCLRSSVWGMPAYRHPPR